MTQEDKNLLLKDLCARLPYGVKLQNIYNIESIVKLRSIDLDDYCYEILFYTYQGKALTVCDKSRLFRFGKILRYKPYLFPLSSMTEEQKEEYVSLQQRVIYNSQGLVNLDVTKYTDWCYKHHIDINGLIPMGLANDATGLNIY